MDSTDDDIFKVEKVLKYRGQGAQREALVKWLGWPKKFNSWIPAKNLIKR